MHYHISGNYQDRLHALWGEWYKYGLQEAIEVAQGLTNAQITKCIGDYPTCMRQIRAEAHRVGEPWPQPTLGYSGLSDK